jgi:hypothetical protein
MMAQLTGLRRLALCAAISLWAAASARGEQLCEMRLLSCPENFSGDTIDVPESIIALSSRIFSCEPTSVVEGVVDTSSPPSIFFIIDHSYSMMGLGNTHPGNDVYGARFSVTRDLLDTIYAQQPDAEVGLAVFREKLFFDDRDNGLFETLDDARGHEAFMPLIRLNQTYDGKTGIEHLRDILRTDTVTLHNQVRDIDVECADLAYQPRFSTIGNTNINDPFDAARQAFGAAANPPHNRFIIFLSDGEPYPTDAATAGEFGCEAVEECHGGAPPFTFRDGANVPATFTVYFDNDQAAAPQSLTTMTGNIRSNGYSSANPISEIWTLKTDYDALMEHLLTYVVRPMLTVTESQPLRMTVNDIVSETYRDSEFVFEKRFGLLPGITRLSFSIEYRLTNMRTSELRDTTVAVDIYVRRTPGVTLPSDLGRFCWDGPSMGIYHEGEPVSRADETMERLQVRLTPGEETPGAPATTIVNAHDADAEEFALDDSGAYWTVSFARTIGEPVGGDGILQHARADSIIAIYRNPDLPLDTLRAAVPFLVGASIAIRSAEWYDVNADGYADSVALAVDGAFDPNDLSALVDMMSIPAARGTIAPNSATAGQASVSFRIDASGATRRNTAVSLADSIVIREGVLPRGGWVVGGGAPALDKMAPVIERASIISYADARRVDTLTVRFTEPVSAVTRQQPFVFRSAESGADFSLSLRNLGSGEHGTGLFEILDEDVTAAAGDSIRIAADGFVADGRDNVQRNPANRLAPIEVTVKRESYSLTPRVLNNPLSEPAPDQRRAMREVVDALPTLGQELRDRGTYPGALDEGMLIMAEAPEGARLGPAFALTGSISIYDVVNNAVILDRPIAFGTLYDAMRVYYLWDGRNMDGRRVAAGSYLAVIETTDDQGATRITTIRLGVQR